MSEPPISYPSLDPNAESNCVFCRIIHNQAPAYKIFEDDTAVVILDINPFSRGHCLVLSRRHVKWWHDLTTPEIKGIFQAAHRVAQKIKKTFQPDFVCLYARGRRIPHVHIFLVPTSGGDPLDRFFNSLEKFQEKSAELAELRKPETLLEVQKLLKL